MSANGLLPDPIRAMGLRIKFARDALGFSQDSLAAAIGLGDRQSLSMIEKGDRRIKPDELLKLSETLKRSVEWFMDPFVVAGEGKFSWRVSPDVPSEELCSFEEKSGALVGLLRFLQISNGEKFDPVAASLKLTVDSSFAQATAMGELVARKLDLGPIPALRLNEKVETDLEIPVLFVDEKEAGNRVSGAMCRLPELAVILINRHESVARRNFDLAHELFHAMTWDKMEPPHRESFEPTLGAKIGKDKHMRVERLADNFAAGLLMPRESIEKVIRSADVSDVSHLTEVAAIFEVTPVSLGYRLLNMGLIEQKVCDELWKVRVPVMKESKPKLFSRKFAQLLHGGILGGHVSTLRAAKALHMTIPDMAHLLKEHGVEVPFSH